MEDDGLIYESLVAPGKAAYLNKNVQKNQNNFCNHLMNNKLE